MMGGWHPPRGPVRTWPRAPRALSVTFQSAEGEGPRQGKRAPGFSAPDPDQQHMLRAARVCRQLEEITYRFGSSVRLRVSTMTCTLRT